MPITHITVRGARQHNLRNVTVRIPRNTLTVITGLSGSGKSSLAFDTIFAEGQRRYVETLSPYARQFLDQTEKPDVDFIEGLSPAIAIEQKSTNRSPRSTVGTITEIYDYLRLLYASIGMPHCPNCHAPISQQSADQIVEQILCLPVEERVTIYAPIVRARKGSFHELLDDLDRKGYRVRIDGGIHDPSDTMELEKERNHTIEAVVYRARLRTGLRNALLAAVAQALRMAAGLVIVATQHEERMFSSRLACANCGISIPELEPRSFSFNSKFGACPKCEGLGSIYDFDPDKIIGNRSRPLLEGAFGPGVSSRALARLIVTTAQRYGFDLDRPFEELSELHQRLLINGPDVHDSMTTEFHGILAYLRTMMEQTRSDRYREYMMNYMTALPCPTCLGHRLRQEALAVEIAGFSITGFTAPPATCALRRVQELSLSARDSQIADKLRKEIIQRLQCLEAMGLGYLSLDRGAATLSGGEAQRIRLAAQIGSRLRGVLYVLDEPSIGLHQRDNQQLIAALKGLRDLGNTVIVVEHDEEMIRQADFVVDLGPGAGRLGGMVVAQGTPDDIIQAQESLTGRYLRGQIARSVRTTPRQLTDKWITIVGARSRNLQNVTARFPLEVMTVVTGVAGSGKSSLVNDTLFRALARALYGSREEPGEHTAILGLDAIDSAIQIDQSPVGRTPRSNPATYTGAFAGLRELFAMLPESRQRGYTAGRFSFNVQGGRCESCQGEGTRRIEMNFLPDAHVKCETCGGRRYNQETLAVKFNGYSIADLLDLSIEDASTVLEDLPHLRPKLNTLVDVGLGYLLLGQSSTTLSGGEAQRMKLARELSKRQTGRTIYILDEPTTGLHFEDVRNLLKVLQRLVDLGNTVLVIEHNLDVINCADWIIDLGPEGGENGGRIVAEGTPDQVAQTRESYTGNFLRRLYNRVVSNPV
jgi:excinuclease ABC subunit A